MELIKFPFYSIVNMLFVGFTISIVSTDKLLNQQSIFANIMKQPIELQIYKMFL